MATILEAPLMRECDGMDGVGPFLQVVLNIPSGLGPFVELKVAIVTATGAAESAPIRYG